jgi:hypothetical protein
MIVARQFIAWYRCENGDRTVGYGMIGSYRRFTIGTISQPGIGIMPCPTGRVFSTGLPGNKLPGYHHLVPAGQVSLVRCVP